MPNQQPITIVGNLTDDPELRFTPSGHAVANFTIAFTPRVFDKQTGEFKDDGDPTYYNASAWRQTGENVAATLAKGQRVIATGNLRVRQYDRKDGTKGTSLDLDIDEIGPALRYATANVTKASKGQAPAPQANAWSTTPPATNQPADPWQTQPAF